MDDASPRRRQHAPEDYLRNNNSPAAEYNLTVEEVFTEKLAMGLRTTEGVTLTQKEKKTPRQKDI